MQSVSDVPVHRQLKEDLWIQENETRSDIPKGVVNDLVHLYVDFETTFCDDKLHQRDEQSDKYKSYATDLLSLGLFYLEFADSIKEGDGQRIIRCWRFLLVCCKEEKLRY